MQVDIIAAEPHVFISIPVGALADAGIGPDDMIEIYVDKDKVVLQKAEIDDTVLCDHDCEYCPLRMLDCCEKNGETTAGKG